MKIMPGDLQIHKLQISNLLGILNPKVVYGFWYNGILYQFKTRSEADRARATRLRLEDLKGKIK